MIRNSYHLPPAPFLKVTDMRAKAEAGYSFDEYSTLDALRENQVPVLFIHGKEDKFVPVWMSEKNYEACSGRKQLLLVDNAGHGSSIFENRDLYEKTETEFLEDAFRQEREAPACAASGAVPSQEQKKPAGTAPGRPVQRRRRNRRRQQMRFRRKGRTAGSRRGQNYRIDIRTQKT